MGSRRRRDPYWPSHTCTRCAHGCEDYRQRGEEIVCIACVDQEAKDARAELQGAQDLAATRGDRVEALERALRHLLRARALHDAGAEAAAWHTAYLVLLVPGLMPSDPPPPADDDGEAASERARMAWPADEVVELYIRSLQWTDAPDEVRTLVAGNIRGFAAYLRYLLAPAARDTAEPGPRLQLHVCPLNCTSARFVTERCPRCGAVGVPVEAA